MLIISFSCIFISIFILSFIGIPFVQKKITIASADRKQEFTDRVEPYVTKKKAQQMGILFVICPIVFGLCVYFMVPVFSFVLVPIAVVLGFIFPYFFIKIMVRKVQKTFQEQLIDALLIMSSSFREGLSLVQAIEAVVEEMPVPIKGEFGLVLAENKMGVSLEDAMDHLYRRMPSVYLQQVITAILLARETGGNLPIIFSRIVTNIRESRKVKQDLETMTIQGKIQGIVMTLLPIAFAFVVYSTNRSVFINMVESPVGKNLLIAAAILWTIGAFLIWKISSFDDF